MTQSVAVLKANLTVQEAADYLGIGKSTMWLRIKQGKVQTYKNGKLRKIKREALLQYEAEMIAEEEGRIHMITITLRAARVNAGLTPEDVEKETGIRPDRLERVEVDSENVTRGEAFKLVRLYGLPLDGIYLGKEAEYHKRLREKIEARKRERGAQLAATI